jgi:hypothetical protein
MDRENSLSLRENTTNKRIKASLIQIPALNIYNVNNKEKLFLF